MSTPHEARNGNDGSIDVFGTPRRVEAAMGRAVRDALRRHKLLGESIAVSRDGKVVIIPAEEIEVPELPDDPA